MSNQLQNNVLVIGGPNAGKTHFGGQLYGRLNSRLFHYRIDPQNRPSDLTIFQEVINRLAEGKRADHTEASANRTIELKVHDHTGTKISFAFPDYAGEQVQRIVVDRKVNTLWNQYLLDSNSWMLFIRLDEILPIEDIINRGLPSTDEIATRNSETPPAKISSAAYFVELLQMMLHIKGSPTFSKTSIPNFTIVLSCWDLLKLDPGTQPSEVLKDRLPMLFHFVKNTWNANALKIIGLSSTEKTLTDVADADYIDRSPIEFGYIITEEGARQKDLTQSITTFIGTK